MNQTKITIFLIPKLLFLVILVTSLSPQRVAVARALINNPSIVMADEPTGNLDSKNAKELHNLFIDLRNRFQQTFLIVTHNEEMAQMSDRILHMKDGNIVFEASIS